MEITGKLIIFVEDVKTEKTAFKKFSTTIASKDENGVYINKSLEVRFNKQNIPEESLNKLLSTKCYTLDVESAWLSVRKYTKVINDQEEDRKVIFLYVDKASVKAAKAIRKGNPNKNDDLPF